MYSASQSRFTTQDPAGMTEGPNMYAYVGNNPVNKRDPTGLNPGDAIIDGGSGTVGCPDGPYDTLQQCINDQQSQEGCYYTCFDNYYP